MTIAPPLVFAWDGEAMVPKHPRLADRHYVVGQQYRLVEETSRSANSERHQFAEIDEAWGNLPEDMALEFPTPTHLRKYALIKAGYCDKSSFVCGSPAEASRLAAYLEPIDEFAIVTVSGDVVTRYTAQSQSRKAMGARKFQDSKTKVLEIVSTMIGVTPATLTTETGRAA